MKQIIKQEYEFKRVKILATATLILGLAAGFKLIHEEQEIEAAMQDLSIPKHMAEDSIIEYDEQNNKLISNNIEYNVEDIKEINGRTVYFVNELTPTPTPTPVVEEEKEYSRYINIESDEYIASEDGVYHEVEPKLNLTFYSVNEIITFYSKVFQLNDEMVASKIYEYIKLDETAWENENYLNGEYYDTKEQAIARLIADISNYPADYGFDEYELATEDYELSQYEPEELIYKFSDVIGVNPYIAEAVACGESGPRLNSDNFEIRYNVGGLRRRAGDPHPATSWGLAIYKNEAEGLYRFVEILHDNFFVGRDDGYDRIVAMSYSYCEDGAYWRNLVGSIYINLVDNGYSYYYDNYSYERDLIYPEEVDNTKIK